MRHAGLGVTTSIKPRGHADHVERQRGEDMLEPRLLQADVACLTQLEGTNALGEGALDAGAAVVALLPLRRLLASPHREQCLVVGLWPQSELARLSGCPRAERAGRTEAAVCPLEPDGDDRVAPLVPVRLPPGADLAPRACRPA